MKESRYAALRASNKARTERLREYMIEIKCRPCADCGFIYDTVCMDFDHRPGEVKLYDIARLARSAGRFEVLQREIAKCDLVCANCHRLRTKERGQWNSSKREPRDDAQLALRGVAS